MSDSHTNPTTIRLDDDDRLLLDALAKDLRLPRSEIVRQAIRMLGKRRRVALPTSSDRTAA